MMNLAIENVSVSLNKAINEIIKERKYKECEVKLSGDTAEGQHFLGIISKIKIFGKTENGEELETNLLCKEATKNMDIRSRVKITTYFNREIETYDKMLHEYQKVLNQLRVKLPIFGFVQCYKTSLEYHGEFLVMEDLNYKGFEMYNRKIPMDFDHVVISIKQISFIHALSFALKEHNPEMYKEISKGLEGDFEDSECLKGFVTMSHATAVDQMKEMPFYQQKLASFENAYEKLVDSISPGLAAPYNVICHGDFWINNLLFKYENGKPVDTRLVDWQMVRHCSPFVDLFHLIFSCTDQDLRREHFEDIINMYYKNLEKYLLLLKCDIKQCYPRSVFDDQFKKLLPYGLVMSPVSLGLLAREAEDVQDMDKFIADINPNANKFELQNHNTQSNFQTSMKGVIEDYIKLGVL